MDEALAQKMVEEKCKKMEDYKKMREEQDKEFQKKMGRAHWFSRGVVLMDMFMINKVCWMLLWIFYKNLFVEGPSAGAHLGENFWK